MKGKYYKFYYKISFSLSKICFALSCKSIFLAIYNFYAPRRQKVFSVSPEVLFPRLRLLPFQIPYQTGWEGQWLYESAFVYPNIWQCPMPQSFWKRSRLSSKRFLSPCPLRKGSGINGLTRGAGRLRHGDKRNPILEVDPHDFRVGV